MLRRTRSFRVRIARASKSLPDEDCVSAGHALARQTHIVVIDDRPLPHCVDGFELMPQATGEVALIEKR